MAGDVVHIAVAGAAGRMGRAIIQAGRETQGIAVVAALEHSGSTALGRDAGELAGIGNTGITVGADVAAALAGADVLVDFTAPAAVMENLKACVRAKRCMVIGTTGLDEAQRAEITAAAANLPVVLAPNMSIGVNLCFKLAELAARIMGETSDVEIFEAHHAAKKDAPSGTALHLGEVVAGALGRRLEDCAVYAREGQTGARPSGAIGFQSIRAGDIVGDHTVLFAAPGERVEITHRAASRRTFAEGALRAARWITGRAPGLYDMQDVLGLR